MNTTITAINDNTMDMKVRELTKTLVANKGKIFKAVFTEKNGNLRTMVFTTNTNWNPLNGIKTTLSGAKMIATKVSRNMATVCEKVLDGCGECVSFRPRTLNLASVITLEMV